MGQKACGVVVLCVRLSQGHPPRTRPCPSLWPRRAAGPCPGRRFLASLVLSPSSSATPQPLSRAGSVCPRGSVPCPVLLPALSQRPGTLPCASIPTHGPHLLTVQTWWRWGSTPSSGTPSRAPAPGRRPCPARGPLPGSPPRLWTRDPIFPWQREGGKPWEERGPPVHPATPGRCVWAAGEPLSCCTLTAAQRERTGSVRGLGGAELLREVSPVPRAASTSRPPPSRGVGAAKPEGLRSGSAPRCPPGPGPASGAQPSRSRGRGALRCAPSRPGCWASPSPACDPEASRGGEGRGGDSVLLPAWDPGLLGFPVVLPQALTGS